ncbi:MAG TPA: hypothetical protein VIJ47_07515 [Acidimicrobiales bacterium]
MGLPEIIALVAVAVVVAAGVSALVFAIAVRRVRRTKDGQGKPTIGI